MLCCRFNTRLTSGQSSTICSCRSIAGGSAEPRRPQVRSGGWLETPRVCVWCWYRSIACGQWRARKRSSDVRRDVGADRSGRYQRDPVGSDWREAIASINYRMRCVCVCVLPGERDDGPLRPEPPARVVVGCVWDVWGSRRRTGPLEHTPHAVSDPARGPRHDSAEAVDAFGRWVEAVRLRKPRRSAVR